MIKASTLFLIMIFTLNLPSFTIKVIGKNVHVLTKQESIQYATPHKSRPIPSSNTTLQPSYNNRFISFIMIVGLVGLLINFVINVIVRLIQEVSKWLQTLLFLFIILALLGIYFEPINTGKTLNVIVDFFSSILGGV